MVLTGGFAHLTDLTGRTLTKTEEGSDAQGQTAESLSTPEVVQQRGRKRRVSRPVVADSSDEEHGCMLIGERTVALCAVAYGTGA